MVGLICAMLIGQTAVGELDLWPKGNPGGWTRTDKETISDEGFKLVRNVSHPTLKLFPAPNAKPGAPVVMVCPGGGYAVEAFDHEGLQIVARLNSEGIHAALLKYRLPNQGEVRWKAPLQDAQRGLRLLRHMAAEHGVKDSPIGIMGFSAGGNLSAVTAAAASATYDPVDDADKLSCRPDFSVLIYPAYLDEVEPGKPGSGKVAPEAAVSAGLPPTFLAQTLDDKPYVTGSLAYVTACQSVGATIEAHFFPHGGHGYGLHSDVAGIKDWPDLLVRWLKGLNPGKP